MDTPEGLHELQYARHILEEILGWPAKTNLELVGDCIRSVSLSRKISLVQAHGYMVRAISLARAQGVTLDRMFFLDGKYTLLRPKREVWDSYKMIDREALREEQESPEWQEASKQARAMLRKLAGMKEML